MMIELIALMEHTAGLQPDSAAARQRLKLALLPLVQMNPRDAKGRTLLHLACDDELCTGRAAGLAELLQYDKLIEMHERREIRFPSPEVFAILLECESDVDALDDERNTPLHLAAGVCLETFMGYGDACLNAMQAVKLLLSAGAHTDTRNKKGRTPLATLNDVMKMDVGCPREN